MRYDLRSSGIGDLAAPPQAMLAGDSDRHVHFPAVQQGCRLVNPRDRYIPGRRETSADRILYLVCCHESLGWVSVPSSRSRKYASIDERKCTRHYSSRDAGSFPESKSVPDRDAFVFVWNGISQFC